jgi:hypothetical protein
MPHKFDLDLGSKIIRGRLEGIVTDETLRKSYNAGSKYGALKGRTLD